MPVKSEIEPGQRIAHFLIDHQIIVRESEDSEPGVATFIFTQLCATSAERWELGVVRYDRETGTVLRFDPYELERRLLLPGFMINVTDPFSTLLLSEGGNFSTGREFELVRAALAQIEANG